MALSANTIWEIQTGGSDTTNGGGFDPSQTAEMFTDGAATLATSAAPVFTSASYNFVAGDVGAWVYIASGTNWTPGWYKIASVAANAATLNATIGSANLKPAASCGPTPTTATGCATVASPTGATWTIDYSQGTSPIFTYTDLASVGAGLTVTSAAHPFGKQQVGNAIIITGGTNFTAGVYVIASVAVVTATVVGPGNITSGVGASGTGSLGGCFASPGFAGSVGVGGNQYMIKSGTFTITSATQNIAAGCFKPTGGNTGAMTYTEGYQTVRGDRGTRPTLILNTGVSTTKIVDLTSATYQRCINLIIDGHSETSSQGLLSGTFTYIELIKAQNCTNSGISLPAGVAVRCETTGCSTQPAFLASVASATNNLLYACESHGNTVTGFSAVGNQLVNCISYANSGASSDGFYTGTARGVFINCSSYNNGRDGFRNDSGNPAAFINCIAEANVVGFNSDNTAGNNPFLINCAGFNNSGGNFTTANYGNGQVFGFLALTASPFTSPGTGNFALNNTAGGGASVKAVGSPTVFPSGTTNNFLDLGAAQAACSAVLAVASGLLRLIGVGRW